MQLGSGGVAVEWSTGNDVIVFFVTYQTPHEEVRPLRLLDDNTTYFVLLSKMEITDGNYTCFIEQDPLCKTRNITSSTVYIDEDTKRYVLDDAAVMQIEKKKDDLRKRLGNIYIIFPDCIVAVAVPRCSSCSQSRSFIEVVVLSR